MIKPLHRNEISFPRENGLPTDKEKEDVTFCSYAHLSPGEIALKMGMSESSIKRKIRHFKESDKKVGFMSFEEWNSYNQEIEKELDNIDPEMLRKGYLIDKRELLNNFQIVNSFGGKKYPEREMNRRQFYEDESDVMTNKWLLENGHVI